jgi:hypothetical protein
MTERPWRLLEVMSFTAQLKPDRMVEVDPWLPWKTLTEMMLA